MMVKFHARGSGKGSGPVDYLLGKDRDREDSRLDRGSAEETVLLIDGLKFAKKYTSGVLSFEEDDLPEEQKRLIMDSFQETLFPGMDANQFSILWVQHKDKGRLELNFVIPNVELQTGKRLQPYFDRADKVRVNAFKNIVNIEYGLSDPDDPARARALKVPSRLPRHKAQAKADITAAIMSLAEAGEIINRADILNALTEEGYEIAAIKPKSISIKNPEGGQNLKLDGAIYAESFEFSTELQEEVGRASEEYKASAPSRLRKAQKDHKRASEIKREELDRRYPKQATPIPAVAKNQHSSVVIAADRSANSGPDLVGGRGLAPRQSAGAKGRERVDSLSTNHEGRELLHDQRELDDVERTRADAIRDCKIISRGAGDRADANESAAAVDQSNAESLCAATQKDGRAGRMLMYANRAVRAFSAITEYCQKILSPTPKPKIDREEGYRGPSM